MPWSTFSGSNPSTGGKAIEPRGNLLSIRPIYGKIPGSPFGSVSFDLKIPSSVEEIPANNISGRIELADIGSGVDLVLETVSGRIETERFSGNRHDSRWG